MLFGLLFENFDLLTCPIFGHVLMLDPIKEILGHIFSSKLSSLFVDSVIILQDFFYFDSNTYLNMEIHVIFYTLQKYIFLEFCSYAPMS